MKRKKNSSWKEVEESSFTTTRKRDSFFLFEC